MVGAWVLTVPAAGLMAAAIWEGTNALGTGGAGPIVMAIVAAAGAAALVVAAQRHAVTAADVLMLAAIVDTGALWKIVLCAFAGGVGVTAIFGFGVARLEALQQARDRRRGASVALNGTVVAICAAVCVAALVLGFLAMTHK
jgi:hypothetical protein